MKLATERKGDGLILRISEPRSPLSSLAKPFIPSFLSISSTSLPHTSIPPYYTTICYHTCPCVVFFFFTQSVLLFSSTAFSSRFTQTLTLTLHHRQGTAKEALTCDAASAEGFLAVMIMTIKMLKFAQQRRRGVLARVWNCR